MGITNDRIDSRFDKKFPLYCGNFVIRFGCEFKIFRHKSCHESYARFTQNLL